MNILFVCRGNVGRSQMAEELLKKMRPELHINSAGTIVRDKDGNNKNGQLLKDCPGAHNVLTALQDLSINASNKARVQLTPDMLEGKDRIIVMAEPENIPAYLSSHPNYVYWHVNDPKGTDLEQHRKTRDEIQALLENHMALFE